MPVFCISRSVNATNVTKMVTVVRQTSRSLHVNRSDVSKLCRRERRRSINAKVSNIHMKGYLRTLVREFDGKQAVYSCNIMITRHLCLFNIAKRAPSRCDQSSVARSCISGDMTLKYQKSDPGAEVHLLMHRLQCSTQDCYDRSSDQGSGSSNASSVS